MILSIIAQQLRQEVRRNLLAEAAKHRVTKLLSEIPFIGQIRAALLLAILQTPHRFRTKRQLWAYSGFAIETHSSAEHRYVRGQLQLSKKPTSVRGLNRSHNHELKNLFKSAATVAAAQPGEGAETRHPGHRDKRRPRHLISRMLRFSILPHWPVFFQDPRGT